MPETHHTFCRICEALCGLRVTVAEGRVLDIAPDPEHVATGGYGCIKGMAQHHLYDSPDRLLHPLERRGDAYDRVSWPHALDRIGQTVRRLRSEHGPDSIAAYIGTAAGFSVLHPIFAQGFMTGLGSASVYASATQDCSNKFAVADAMYGFPFTQPFPDVERTECLIIVGANPAISRWSFLQVPNPVRQLRAITARGGRLFVVDPRRTETAKAAGRHLFIRPGTDVFFYLAFLHELIATDGVASEVVAHHGEGFPAIRALCEPWSPERCAEVTRMPAADLRELVSAYQRANGAALYSSTGVNMGGQGALGFWLQEVINLVSGNLDRPGGTLVGHGIFDFPRFGRKRGILRRSDRSRIGDFGSVNDAFPGGLLADEILTPGERQVRALFVTGGNPLLTMANAGRLRRAFEQLELLVCLDVQQGETASLAHYVLPCTSPLQRPDLPFVFPLMLGLQRRPYLQATRAVVPPSGEQRDEASIYVDLARACGISLFGSRLTQRSLELAARAHGCDAPDAPRAVPQERLLSLLLRLCGEGSFAGLLRHPHGRLRPEHRGGDFLGHRVLTDSGRVNLAPAALVEQARDLEALFERERQDTGLRLITKRATTSQNSWTHNHAPFAFRSGGTNYLYVHPRDAERLGLREGDLADVRSATATVRVPVRLLADLMPGTVALPHGWGHQGARGLSVARTTRGVNVNLLAADGPDHLERTSGMARLTAIPVEVTPAAGAQEPGSWSGLPE